MPSPSVPALRPIPIDAVQVEIGVGSPIPVDVIASGTWPDLCAQVAHVVQRVSDKHFEIDLMALPTDPACRPDTLGLPFRMDMPINIVQLPAGTYSVSVNGVETSFEWSINPAGGGVFNPDLPGDLRPLKVIGLTVEVGVGSPIPVEVVASGDWPDPCAQLAEIQQQVNGTDIEITLLASPADPSCPPDFVGVPFRVAVPLNMAEMPVGKYNITVNGYQTEFVWPATANVPIPVENAGLVFAYIGADGNLWLAEPTGAGPRQITSDAMPISADADNVTYYSPKISSDGRYVAVRRDAGTPVESGMRYVFDLMVYDTGTGESRSVFQGEVPPAGMDWKPGTHLLAYGKGSNPGYFTTRGGKPDATLATGIYGVDMDTGETSVLVEPERGYLLLQPSWSPDGRFLSFDELLYMEGKGPFAYYDFEAKQYVAWEDQLGFYDWSPDGNQIVYDRMTYSATGEERIFSRARQDGVEQQISPDPEQGYQFLPIFSPDGTQVAYLANLGGPDSMQYTLMVQAYPQGEPRPLGTFESVWYLEWSSDGSTLVFSAGPHLSQEVIGVNVVDGSVTTLAQGNQPTVAMP